MPAAAGLPSATLGRGLARLAGRPSAGGARHRRLRLALALAAGGLGLLLCGEALFLHAKAALAQLLLQRAFAVTLATGQPTRPWPWADTWPVARIELPRQSASLIALAGGSGQALAFGPGQLDGTPPAGEPGWAIFAAHRNTHFRVLRDVAPGDPVRVTRADGAVVRFRVSGTAVVRWDASGLDPRAAGRGVVLVTCWPFEALRFGPLRYLVFAEAVPGDEPPAP
jgi:sortase A